MFIGKNQILTFNMLCIFGPSSLVLIYGFSVPFLFNYLFHFCSNRRKMLKYLINSKFNVKLADFGLARCLESSCDE